jgi:hypothetical protein
MIGTNAIMLKKEQVIGAVTTVEQWNHMQVDKRFLWPQTRNHLYLVENRSCIGIFVIL